MEVGEEVIFPILCRYRLILELVNVWLNKRLKHLWNASMYNMYGLNGKGLTIQTVYTKYVSIENTSAQTIVSLEQGKSIEDGVV